MNRLLRATAMAVPSALVVLSGSSGLAEDRRIDPSTLSILTFNAEWLWDGQDPEDGQIDDFPWHGAPAASSDRLDAVADVIARNDADIVNLVEIEGAHILEELLDRLPESGYRAYFVEGTDSFTGQDLGLLTRIDPVDEEIYRTDERRNLGDTADTSGVSKNWYAVFPVAGFERPVAVIAAHLISRPVDTRRVLQRTAQAEVLADLAVALSAEADVVILGDLNDWDPDIPDLDVASDPVSQVLPILRALTPSPDDDLASALALLPEEERFTHFYDDPQNGAIDADTDLSALDHILFPSHWTAVAYLDADPIFSGLSDHAALMIVVEVP